MSAPCIKCGAARSCEHRKLAPPPVPASVDCRERHRLPKPRRYHGTNKNWPCGHPRTPENTTSVGRAGERCKKCRRKISDKSGKKIRRKQRREGEGAMARTSKVFLKVSTIARKGAPLPPLGELADALNCKRHQVGDSLAFLIAAGMVEVKHRRVTVGGAA